MELKMKNLTKRYGDKAAVDRLNVSLTKRVYGLLGANGAGKTTWMRLICGVQKPTSGKILFNGRSIETLGEKYREQIGYLPQHFPYYPNFSALEYMLYIGALKGMEAKESER